MTDPKHSNGRVDIVYQELRTLREEQREGFARLEDRLTRRMDDQDGRMDRHDDRLRSLEGSRRWLIGAGTVIGAALTMAWQWLARRGGG